MKRRESIKRGMGSRWAASMTANTYWAALRDIGEIDGCLSVEGGVCVWGGVGAEEEDAASNFLPHPLDTALNTSLPAKL